MLRSIGNFHDRLTFDPGNMNKTFHVIKIEHVNISKIAKFGGEMLAAKYSPAKFANFVYISITHGKASHV